MTIGCVDVQASSASSLERLHVLVRQLRESVRLDTPRFERTGPPHDPTFTCLWRLSDLDGCELFVGSASGQKKKQAQHSAGTKILEFLEQAKAQQEFQTLEAPQTVGKSSPLEDLNMIVQKFPQVHIVTTQYFSSGPDHARDFSCSIQARYETNSLRASGMGPSKTKAHQGAAAHILEQLKELGVSLSAPAEEKVKSAIETIVNPIGTVNELFQKLHAVPPRYVTSALRPGEKVPAFQSLARGHHPLRQDEPFSLQGEEQSSKKAAEHSAARAVLRMLEKEGLR